jgi:hypothetical protein
VNLRNCKESRALRTPFPARLYPREKVSTIIILTLPPNSRHTSKESAAWSMALPFHTYAISFTPLLVSQTSRFGELVVLICLGSGKGHCEEQGREKELQEGSNSKKPGCGKELGFLHCTCSFAFLSFPNLQTAIDSNNEAENPACVVESLSRAEDPPCKVDLRATNSSSTTWLGRCATVQPDPRAISRRA